MSYAGPRNRTDFQIAIICALPLEYDAVAYAIDEEWDEEETQLGKAGGDFNQYSIGRIGSHYVVIILLSHIGNNPAASAGASLHSSFSNIELGLLVGVCAVVPTAQDGQAIFLGDVIISKSVVQYDFGRHDGNGFVRKSAHNDNLGRPAKAISNLQVILESEVGRERLQCKSAECFQRLIENAGKKGLRGRYLGPERNDERSNVCNPILKQPRVHVGSIASGNTVMKSKEARDRISLQEGIIAFEMEGAGLWNELPSVVIIKGACDYADSSKKKEWQHSAAGRAAAVSLAFLKRYTSSIGSIPANIVTSEGRPDIFVSENSAEGWRTEQNNRITIPAGYSNIRITGNRATGGSKQNNIVA